MTQLQKCEGPDKTFSARTVKTHTFLTAHTIQQVTDYAIEKMDKSGGYVPELTLRKGAQVMLLTNKYIDSGLVNGSRGVVEKFCDGPIPLPMVKFRNGEVLIIENHAWASEDVEGLERHQIPLRLAYAITIHKAQGATLDCALIDIGDNTFEYGQAYVALSRVRSLDCLYIWDLSAAAFMVHPKVKAFLDTVYSMESSLPTPDPQTLISPMSLTSDHNIRISALPTDFTESTSDDPS
jgi:ATP-dependent DNA helicase PIF1